VKPKNPPPDRPIAYIFLHGFLTARFIKPMKHFLLSACVLLFFCAPAPVIKGAPSTFRYSTIASKCIAFAKPIVTSSEIFYENRFTNQSYHSIDKIRTQDAFYRDFRQKIVKAKLEWKELDSGIDSLLQVKYGYTTAPLDSFFAPVRERLMANGIDIVVVVYAIRLYHFQTVGLRPDRTGSVNSYGTIINKKIEYLCSIMDVSENRALFCLPMKQEENSPSLNILENSVDGLFEMLLRR
jgi:hypothetical protein